MNLRVGLIDVDGHKGYPNLALMKVSAYHKKRRDDVTWWWSDFIHYNIVYKSKVFSDAYTKDVPDPMNADLVVRGGTGYAIETVDGKEIFHPELCEPLPDEIEHTFPDYSMYPRTDFAVSITSRGCPRGCGFCVIAGKEGRRSVKVADVSDYWRPETGLKRIQVMDANLTACPDKRDLFSQYAATGCLIEFNQGLDIRLLDDDDINDLNNMRLESLHFAWDNPAEDLYPAFIRFAKKYTGKKRNRTGVYVLTNYEPGLSDIEHEQRALERVIKLRELGYNPYLMIYDKPHAGKRVKHLSQWVNNKVIFHACPDYYMFIE